MESGMPQVKDSEIFDKQGNHTMVSFVQVFKLPLITRKSKFITQWTELEDGSLAMMLHKVRHHRLQHLGCKRRRGVVICVEAGHDREGSSTEFTELTELDSQTVGFCKFCKFCPRRSG